MTHQHPPNPHNLTNLITVITKEFIQEVKTTKILTDLLKHLHPHQTHKQKTKRNKNTKGNFMI